MTRKETALNLAVFADLFGFGMLIADFQLRAEEVIPNHWPVGAVIGIMLASTFVTQTIVSPRWGSLSDRAGRKSVFIACTILSASAMLVYGFAFEAWGLLLSRILAGLGGANVAIAQACLTDDGEEGRAGRLGRLGAFLSAGLVMGPPIGGFLSHRFGHGMLGFVGAAASLLGLALVAFTLPNDRPKSPMKARSVGIFDFQILKDFPDLRPYVSVAVVAWFSLATLEGTFGRLIQKLFSYGSQEFGIIFGYESALGLVVSGVLVGWLAGRLRDTAQLRFSYLAQGLGLALNPVAVMLPIPAMVSLLFASTLYAVGSGIANPVINTICSRIAPENRQGELFGLMQGTRSLGFVLGPVLGGILFDWRPAAPYLLAGSVCLLATFLVPRDQRMDSQTAA